MITVTGNQVVDHEEDVEVQCATCGLGLNAEYFERNRPMRYLKKNLIEVEPCAKCTADAINESQGRK